MKETEEEEVGEPPCLQGHSGCCALGPKGHRSGAVLRTGSQGGWSMSWGHLEENLSKLEAGGGETEGVCFLLSQGKTRAAG